MSVAEELVENLERELEALKSAYEQAGTQMPIFEKSASLKVSGNDKKGVLVTFSTETGANAIASIMIKDENTELGETFFTNGHRVPYNGGARWVYPAGDGAIVDVTVRAMVNGNLSLEAI